MKRALTFEQKIGRRIASLRQNSGVLQKELAAYLKVTVSTVSHYEAGINMPQPAILVKIASFFGVSVDYILGQTELKIDWQTFQRDISLVNGKQISLETVINKFMSLSEQNQADICKLIDLYILDDKINGKSDEKDASFDADEANRMMLTWLNDND